uniref:Protein FAM136A n=1 Tax=Cairina moschata TaxID=8855 RepID=A0A8C3CGX1_CAIMO
MQQHSIARACSIASHAAQCTGAAGTLAHQCSIALRAALHTVTASHILTVLHSVQHHPPVWHCTARSVTHLLSTARCCSVARSYTAARCCSVACFAALCTVTALCTVAMLHDRLSRCTLHCNDKAKDALEAGGTEARVRAQLDACVAACGDDHLRLIPAMAKKMKDSLAALRQ